jgi:cytoskeletal protein RodZ
VPRYPIAIVVGWVAAVAWLVCAAQTQPATPPKAPSKAPAKNSTAKSVTPKSATANKAPASSASKKGPAPAAKKSTVARKKSSRRTPVRSYRASQQAPTPARYKEIQQALADKGYLQGAPTGAWGAESADALKRFQQDRNLEPTGKLDSLSLIALGLGPKHEGATNLGQARTAATQPTGQAPTGPAPSDQPREGPPH